MLHALYLENTAVALNLIVYDDCIICSYHLCIYLCEKRDVISNSHQPLCLCPQHLLVRSCDSPNLIQSKASEAEKLQDLHLMQIQRASGAYMVSARKKGLSASKTPCLAHDPPSPLPFPDFATLSSEMDVACSEEADSSLAEDEEIVTGEHSHMYGSHHY